MIRITKLFFLCAFGVVGFGNAAQQTNEANDPGNLRHLSDLVNGISEKITSESTEETALYQEMTSFCKARQHKAVNKLLTKVVDKAIAQSSTAASTVDASAKSTVQDSATTSADDSTAGVTADAKTDSTAVSTEDEAAQSSQDEDAATAAPVAAAETASVVEYDPDAATASVEKVKQPVADVQPVTQDDDNDELDPVGPLPQEPVADEESAPIVPKPVVARVAPVPVVSQVAMQKAEKTVEAMFKSAMDDLVTDMPASADEGSSQKTAEVVKSAMDDLVTDVPIPAVAGNSQKTTEVVKSAIDDLVTDMPASAVEGTSQKTAQVVKSAMDDLVTDMPASAVEGHSQKTAQVLQDKTSSVDAEKELQQMQAVLKSSKEIQKVDAEVLKSFQDDQSTASKEVKAEAPARHTTPHHVNMKASSRSHKKAQPKKVHAVPASHQSARPKKLAVPPAKALPLEVHAVAANHQRARPKKLRAPPAKVQHQQMHAVPAHHQSAHPKQMRAQPAKTQKQKVQATPPSHQRDRPKKLVAPTATAKPQKVRAVPASHARSHPKPLRVPSASPTKTQQQKLKAVLAHPKKFQKQKVQAMHASQKATQPQKATAAPLPKKQKPKAAVASDDDSTEQEAEQELQKMQDLLSTTDDISTSDVDTEVKAQQPKPVPAPKPVPVPKVQAPAKKTAHHAMPPRKISQLPIVHAAASPKKVVKARATPTAHKQAPKKNHKRQRVSPTSSIKQTPRKARNLQHQKINPEIAREMATNQYSSKELEQMDELLKYDDVQPSKLAVKPVAKLAVAVKPVAVKPLVKTIKPDKSADAVVAESEALENVIDEEETKLNAVANTRTAGQEAQLKKQMKDYVESDGLNGDVIAEEKMDESGFVDFDADASSAVSVSNSLKKTVNALVSRETVVKAAPVPTKQLASRTESEIDEADADVANAEKELVPMADGTAAPKAAAQAAPKPVASKQQPVVAEISKKEELSLASETAALDDLSGAIPNIEKEALQLYNSFGGPPAPLETLSFLEVSKRKQHSQWTPGIPSAANLDKAFDMLRQASKMKTGFVQLQASGAVKHLSEHDIDQECDWLMNHFEHRQELRAQETEWLQHAHQLLGAANVESQGARNLRGGQ